MSRRFRIRSTLAAALAAVAVVAVPTFAASSVGNAAPQQSAQQQLAPASRAGTVTVTGAVRHPLRLTDAQLAAMPSTVVPVVYGTSKGTEAHIFRGPELYTVLQKAQPAVKPDVHNDALRFVVLATGADGYAAALSLAEFDPNLAGTKVLIARYMDGKKLAEPRIVVPGDAKGGRYVSTLRSLKVTRLG